MVFSKDQLHRYADHLLLPEVGAAGQLRLARARVLVIGAGGLGSPLLLYLAAAGVGSTGKGTIGIADHDSVTLANLQRQVVHDTPAIGQPKTVSALGRLRALNPETVVTPHPHSIVQDNAHHLIADYDLVADASDNAPTRYLVNDICFRTATCLVSASVTGFEGQLTTFKSYLDGDYPCYRCLFPTSSSSSRPCGDVGVMGASAGVVGAMQAGEVIKEILGVGHSLAGCLLIYDGLNAATHKFKIRRRWGCELCGHKYRP